MNIIKAQYFSKSIITIILFSLFLSCNSIPQDKNVGRVPIIGVWKSHDDVTLYDEAEPPAIFAEFTVDTTMTVFADRKFHLINELVDSDPNGQFTGSEEYTGTWEKVSDTSYDMKANDISTWGDGTGKYDPSSDTFSTVWVEPRGTFNTHFIRFK